MKLARPDVFHPRIVLAGCPALPEGDGDDAGLVAALGKHGLHARWMSWDDPATLEADLVILRATWDYIDRLDEFLSWTRRVRHLLNPARVVPWNSDKRYLADLAAAGVPTVPTRFVDPGDAVRLPNSDEVVVKPAVGVGSVEGLRFSDRDEARRHADRLLAAGRTVLIQPYDERIEDGETALVFIGGAQSHAFAKCPADPDFEVWDVGHQALAAAAAHLDLSPEELLYARVDVIGGHADPRVLEVELIEPSLGWMQLDETTRGRQHREFVVAVESALDRFGLGPLSHRRP
ncbi:hypothetical protein AU190_12865 [Mycolicibacterium acapulense]|uniref:ATP-grasp domain-containing protein n=1 Tax=Mycobacterium lehmannii TaxID=2048550 RepID=A0A117JKJ2_9MYCO|nr:hypothetical protein [Mycobacterium lehmannii]KUH97581.1 hypothetical protein AU190_12865 [Mycolicibacterium acapulense]KUI07479.1 hypothetical protein AU191_18315 [Mycolicibacterium acapulense]KUI17899.1 hypothetical protein AU192_03390 [Mycobacterium lehmannii]